MGRDENILVFLDTELLCKNNEMLRRSVERATRNQKLILEDDILFDINRNVFEHEAQVVVSKKRTLEAASAYIGLRTAVHNFASASNPGGGVVNGAGAQEECICRCTGLYFNLDTKRMWEGFYEPHRASQNPIHNDDIIYTPKVTVFKSDTESPKLLSEDLWYDVNVITCAAPNLRHRPRNRYNLGDGSKSIKLGSKGLQAIHENRLRRILDIAVVEGNEVVILGAFGCGAFMNNPEIVAAAARNVIKEYKHAFKTIEFAVYCSPSDDTNYRVFNRTLCV